MSAAAPKHAASRDETVYATPRVKVGRRSHLRVVAPLRPSRAGLGVYSLFLLGVLGLGLIMVLLINTSLAQGAYTISELQKEQAVLAETEQTLAETVALESTPAALESKARDIGMVPSETPVFLTLPDGKVMGKAKPAQGNPVLKPFATPADQTAEEGVDNRAVEDMPVSPGEDYDPAAQDAKKRDSNDGADVDPALVIDPQAGE